MKKISIAILCAAATCTMQVSAVDPGATSKDHQIRHEEIIQSKHGIVKSDLPYALSCSPSKAKQQYTIDFVQPENACFDFVLGVAIDNATGEVLYYGDNYDWPVATLGSQECTLLFWGEEYDFPYSSYLYADENFMPCESGEYIVDFTKCTEEIRFQSMLADGSIGRCPLVNYDTDENVEDGTVNYGVWRDFVFVKDLLIDYKAGSMDRGIFDDGWGFDDEEAGNFFVNPGLETVSVVQHRMMAGEPDHEGIYYTVIPAIPATGGCHSNLPESYAYVHCPLSVGTADDADIFDYASLNVTGTYRGMPLIEEHRWNRLGAIPATDHYYFCGNEAIEQFGLALYSAPGRIMSTGYDFSTDKESPLGVISHLVMNDAGIPYYIGNQNTMYAPGCLSTRNGFKFGAGGTKDWSPNPWLDIPASDTKIIDGNSAPIVVSEQWWYTKKVSEEQGLRNTLYHNFIGRNGETRSIDFLGQQIKAYVDGSEVDFSEYPSLNRYLAYNARGGVWDIEISDDNVKVNDVKGYNHTHIHFDANGDDVWAPTMQCLRTLDANGCIADAFTAGENASLMIYGGDFESHYNEIFNNEWFSVTPCEIEVEISESGADEWTSINAELAPEKFMMPGWGYCWNVSLADIPGKPGAASYDMRITLSDESGNYQQQTLSPVFTIDAATGLQSIPAYDEKATYYDLQGSQVLIPGKGIFIEMKDGEAPRKVTIR